MKSNVSEKTERGIGQRGPDRKQRVFNPKSLSNLKQFQKHVSETNLSVNPAVNSGVTWSRVGKILVLIIVSGLLWNMYNQKKNEELGK